MALAVTAAHAPLLQATPQMHSPGSGELASPDRLAEDVRVHVRHAGLI